MSDILSTIEKTLAEAADPSLKKKKNKKSSRQQKKNELRNFDNLDQFRDFLKMETTSDYEEKVHAHLSYFPPFVMQSCHNDPEKIKPTMNKNNKKFVRRLSQHVNKHLIDDIKKNSDFGDEIAFEEIDENDTFDKLVWHFVDANEHESNGKKFKLEMDVECHNDNATVEVDYRAYPC